MRGLVAVGLCGFGVLALGVLDAGCSIAPTCERLCAKTNACPGVKAVDCSKVCGAYDAVTTAANCQTQSDNATLCQGSIADICNPAPGACQTEVGSFSSCWYPYCKGHANDPNCQVLNPPVT